MLMLDWIGGGVQVGKGQRQRESVLNDERGDGKCLVLRVQCDVRFE